MPEPSPSIPTGTGHRERLRGRFLAGEETALADESLLELLLTTASPARNSPTSSTPSPSSAARNSPPSANTSPSARHWRSLKGSSHDKGPPHPDSLEGCFRCSPPDRTFRRRSSRSSSASPFASRKRRYLLSDPPGFQGNRGFPAVF